MGYPFPIHHCPGLVLDALAGPAPGGRDELQEILWTGYFFQRAINFVGSWKESDYVVEMDAKVDGNRRIKSTIGVINQRYIFALVGNANTLQVVSNYDRFQRSVPFPIKANQWYRIKTQIDIQDDGTGLVRARPGHEMRQSPKIGPWRKFTPVHTSKVLPVSMPFLRRVKKGVF